MIPDLPMPAGLKSKLKVLVVVPDQRVPLRRTNEQLSSTLVKRTPSRRRIATTGQREHYLQIFGQDNPIMRSFGLTIGRNAHSDMIKVRDLLTIQYANEQFNVDSAEAT